MLPLVKLQFHPFVFVVFQTLWEGEVLEEKLSAVANGAVEDGFTFVFKLCLSLLTKWFKTPGVKVKK